MTDVEHLLMQTEVSTTLRLGTNALELNVSLALDRRKEPTLDGKVLGIIKRAPSVMIL